MKVFMSSDLSCKDPSFVTAPPEWSHSPARVNCSNVLRFCSELHPAGRPVVVPVRPDLLYGEGPVPLGRCYEGVEEYVSRLGGNFQHGWMIWETQGIYLRAFHHSVHWDGLALTDVSPQPAWKILFLPTAMPGETDEAFQQAKQWDGNEGVRCRYFSLSDSALVRRIISLHEAKDVAGKHSTEWFGLLDEIALLESQFHEWDEVKTAAAKRRKGTRQLIRARI